MTGCPDVIACPNACCNGELSQQPMWPHCAQRHKWYHQPVPCPASHSTHPAPLGSASGSTPCTVIAAALARRRAPRPGRPPGARPGSVDRCETDHPNVPPSSRCSARSSVASRSRPRRPLPRHSAVALGWRGLRSRSPPSDPVVQPLRCPRAGSGPRSALPAVARVLGPGPVSYTHLRAHETPEHLVCRLLLEKKKQNTNEKIILNTLL